MCGLSSANQILSTASQSSHHVLFPLCLSSLTSLCLTFPLAQDLYPQHIVPSDIRADDDCVNQQG